MDRSLIEASEDLYATPFATFRQVTLPLLVPAIVAGFLLSFTFSFEDFIIAFFVAGPNNTLPIYVFSSIRRGITPEINAIGTVVLTVSLTLLVLAQVILQRSDPQATGARNRLSKKLSRAVELSHQADDALPPEHTFAQALRVKTVTRGCFGMRNPCGAR